MISADDDADAVVNIAGYAFVEIDDADELTKRLRETARRNGLLGTILIADEGINLFLAGRHAAIDRFVAELRADARFAAIAIRRSRSTTAPFAHLKVKRKRETITFGQAGLKPHERRAPGVTPATLQRWIEQGHDNSGRALLLLDTRNREEVHHGSFSGATTLGIDRFSEFPVAVERLREQLVDRTVVSFCTGGIRCEKAALWMLGHGFDRVLQLDGGILGYFDAVGGFGYDGDCFVFDDRVALDTSLRPRKPSATDAAA